MARKLIQLRADQGTFKLILRELQLLHDCSSPHIVSFYGAFLNDDTISMCMEFMDVGSFDRIYRKLGKLPPEIVGKVCEAVLEGLDYLHRTHKITHRDVKPSNILLNSKGEVKICDFGVSGQLIQSKAQTFVGTSYYMAPERIQGGVHYGVQSDSWSVGLSLLEMATGVFPFKPMPIFELVMYIVKEPAPKANEGSPEFKDFIAQCLIKEDAKRPTPTQLLNHEFVVKSKQASVDLKAFAEKVGTV